MTKTREVCIYELPIPDPSFNEAAQAALANHNELCAVLEAMHAIRRVVRARSVEFGTIEFYATRT